MSTPTPTTCPKCDATSGDNWSQCDGVCPMPGSPHYRPPACDGKCASGECVCDFDLQAGGSLFGLKPIDFRGPVVSDGGKNINGNTILAALRGRENQPAPVVTQGPAIVDLVRADLNRRAEKGLATYGTKLQAFNGRDALWDAYEEALDLAMYLRQAISERSGQPEPKPCPECMVRSR